MFYKTFTTRTKAQIYAFGQTLKHYIWLNEEILVSYQQDPILNLITQILYLALKMEKLHQLS